MSGVAAVPALAGIVLAGFGNLGDLTQQNNPWRGFKADDFNLASYRAEHVPGANCARWLEALVAETRGTRVHAPGFKDGFATWAPWEGDDLDAVKDCDKYPCDVKLNETEAHEMKAQPKEGRLAEFEKLTSARAEHYYKTGERKEYEFPGDPVDPWAFFEKAGLHSSVKLPQKPDLWIRKFNFDPKKMKTLHQILDLRVARAPGGKEATLWLRDAYTDHYFDGWGEWATVVCDPPPAKAGVSVIQALFLEVDLLKKTDLFSRIARGKLRGAIEEQGSRYLDDGFGRIKNFAVQKSD
jgi:hypothetical protein